MSEKRRGLGRGLGALIPAGLDGSRQAPGGDRPVDVFFPDRSDATSTSAQATAAESEGVAQANAEAAASASNAPAADAPSAAQGSDTHVNGNGGSVGLVVEAGPAAARASGAVEVDGLEHARTFLIPRRDAMRRATLHMGEA